MGRKTNKKSMSHGTAPLNLIVTDNSDTYIKYWYILVAVTIPIKGLQWDMLLSHKSPSS